MDQHALRYWVAFNRVKGIGAVRFYDLLTYFGDLEVAWNAPEAELLKVVADQRACNSILKTRRTADLDAALEEVARHGAYVVTLQDAEYPLLLRQIDHPPPLLYVKGTLSDADQQAIGIVGTRKATTYGTQAAQQFASALSKAGLTIISGLAKGIDSIAHRAALEAGGRTLALLGHGIDTLYPAENKALAARIVEQGALLTEFPIGTVPAGQNFPQRNRLISGLSLGIVIIEAQQNSGALSTIRYALDQGREAFAVPGNIFAPPSQGTNLLIQAGEAKLISRVEDILDELKLMPALPTRRRSSVPSDRADTIRRDPPRTAPATQDISPTDEHEREPDHAQLSETEALIIGCLGTQPTYIDEICTLSGLTAGLVVGTLTMLELHGWVRQVGTHNYVLS